jgi:hypothetical protein
MKGHEQTATKGDKQNSHQRNNLDIRFGKDTLNQSCCCQHTSTENNHAKDSVFESQISLPYRIY